MRILSGALPATDAFLHVGYLSAFIRSVGGMNFPEDTLKLFQGGDPVNVAEALRLQGEAPPTGPSATYARPTGKDSSISMATMGFLFYFVLGLMLLYASRAFMRSHRVLGLAFIATVALFAVSAGVVLITHAAIEPPSLPLDSPPPWQGIAVREYADPGTATRVLMHGVLTDAVANAGSTVKTLAQVKDEVGLPEPHLTEGERYALQTYGLDGWGNPFRLKGPFAAKPRNETPLLLRRLDQPVPDPPDVDATQRGPYYILTSAGPDGAFETPDDLRTNILPCTDDDWDGVLHAAYLYKDDGQILLAFHRWKGAKFQYADKERSQRLFGGLLYDVRPAEVKEGTPEKEILHYLRRLSSAPIRKNYERIASKVPYTPLVLMLPPAEAATAPTATGTPNG